MSIDAEGILAFGVVVSEDNDDTIPWLGDEFDGDVEEWWLAINQADLASDKFRTDWLARHPLPFKLHHSTSHDYNDFIVAMPGHSMTAECGYPLVVVPWGVSEEDASNFAKKLADLGITHKDPPNWYLAGAIT